MVQAADRRRILAKFGIPSADHGLFDYMREARYGMVTIEGGSGKGKTKLASLLMLELIALGKRQLPDEYRYQFVNAPQAFNDAKRFQYDDEHNELDLLSHSLVLGLDDFDRVDTRECGLASRVLVNRSDANKFTILTITNTNTLRNFGDQIVRRAREGKRIVL